MTNKQMLKKILEVEITERDKKQVKEMLKYAEQDIYELDFFNIENIENIYRDMLEGIDYTLFNEILKTFKVPNFSRYQKDEDIQAYFEMFFEKEFLEITEIYKEEILEFLTEENLI